MRTQGGGFLSIPPPLFCRPCVVQSFKRTVGAAAGSVTGVGVCTAMYGLGAGLNDLFDESGLQCTGI